MHSRLDQLLRSDVVSAVYLLSLFVSVTPPVSVPCQLVSWDATGSEFSRIQQGAPATQAFAIFLNSMICSMIFHGGAPERRVQRKVNNNRILKEENLAFIGCGVVGMAVVDDVEVVELLS
jgi:hypothetical protein